MFVPSVADMPTLIAAATLVHPAVSLFWPAAFALILSSVLCLVFFLFAG